MKNLESRNKDPKKMTYNKTFQKLSRFLFEYTQVQRVYDVATSSTQ